MPRRHVEGRIVDRDVRRRRVPARERANFVGAALLDANAVARGEAKSIVERGAAT
jgi:hypothetical protein